MNEDRIDELEKRLEDLESTRLFRHRLRRRVRRHRSNPIPDTPKPTGPSGTAWISFEAEYLQIMKQVLDALRAFGAPKGPSVDAEFLSTPDPKENLGVDPTLFLEELSALVNKHSLQKGSNTPDFILAKHLCECVESLNATVRRRERWYGR